MARDIDLAFGDQRCGEIEHDGRGALTWNAGAKRRRRQPPIEAPERRDQDRAGGVDEMDRDESRSRGAGAIRAFGEHKGSGLALLCELIGGSLTGNGATGPDRKFSNGMFSVYLDPSQVDPSHVFDADMTRYLDWFQQGKAIPGEAIMTPGEPERASRAKRSRSGVPLPAEAWASIVVAARSVGVNRDLSF